MLLASGCSSDSASQQELDHGLAISNEPKFTTALGVERVDPANPAAPTEIRWTPGYDITNNTGKQVRLIDVEPSFPTGVLASNNATVALTETRPTETVDIYFSTAELDAQHPSATQRPPVVIEPGRHLVVAFHQALQLKVDGRVLRIPDGRPTAAYLGPLLRLTREPDGQYHCATNYPLAITVRTTSGNTSRMIPHVILPDGCVLQIPAEDGSPPR